MLSKVAIVTGANKGIGFSIVKTLLKENKFQVYLTSRDEKRGLEAVKKMKDEFNLQPLYHLLDVSKPASIRKFRDYVIEKHGGVDVLVNNAGVAYMNPGDSKILDYEKSEDIIKTNYYGLLNVCEAFFPLLNENARVVNISSTIGLLSRIKNPNIRERLAAQDLSEDEIDEYVQEFLSLLKEGVNLKAGWPNSAYAVSKVFVSALTRVQQRRLDALGKGGVVNSCCPGWVKTDLTFGQGKKTPDEGAETPVYCALLPVGADTSKGEFIFEKKVKNWAA